MRTGLILSAVTWVGIAVCLSNCGMAYTPSPFQRGNFVLAGDERGVRAFMQGQNGLVQHGKEHPTDNSYWVSQRQQEREETSRAYAPSWISTLFHGSSPAAIQEDK